MRGQTHTWPNSISKIGVEPSIESIALPSTKNCAIYFQTGAKRDEDEVHPCAFTQAGASLFVPVKQARKKSHAILKSIKCFSAAQVENIRHSKGSVSQFLLNCSLDEVYV